MWPVTLNELEGHSSVSELFKCKSSTFYAEFYKISADTPMSRGPLVTAGLLVVLTFVAYARTDNNRYLLLWYGNMGMSATKSPENVREFNRLSWFPL